MLLRPSIYIAALLVLTAAPPAWADAGVPPVQQQGDAAADGGDAGGACASARDESSCLSQATCGWGDRGSGAECYRVGSVDAQPGSGDPGGGGGSAGAGEIGCSIRTPPATAQAALGSWLFAVFAALLLKRRAR